MELGLGSRLGLGLGLGMAQSMLGGKGVEHLGHVAHDA